jgi:hypothetical protein
MSRRLPICLRQVEKVHATKTKPAFTAGLGNEEVCQSGAAAGLQGRVAPPMPA